MISPVLLGKASCLFFIALRIRIAGINSPAGASGGRNGLTIEPCDLPALKCEAVSSTATIYPYWLYSGSERGTVCVRKRCRYLSMLH